MFLSVDLSRAEEPGGKSRKRSRPCYSLFDERRAENRLATNSIEIFLERIKENLFGFLSIGQVKRRSAESAETNMKMFRLVFHGRTNNELLCDTCCVIEIALIDDDLSMKIESHKKSEEQTKIVIRLQR